jgi:hypothetical protein
MDLAAAAGARGARGVDVVTVSQPWESKGY